MKTLKILLMLFMFMVLTPDAHSQGFTARGLDSSERAQVTCLAEVERMRGQLSDLQDIKRELIRCNNNGQVYAGEDEGCVNLDALTANWSPTSRSPGALSFDDKEGQQMADPITVVRGSDGANSSCPSGFRPE